MKDNLGQKLDLETTGKSEGKLKLSVGTENLFSLLF